MSKAFKRGLCAYCGSAESSTADHVIARGFFPKDLRANLPKVGACKDCNHKKSVLEHTLTALMPFGATHERAKEAILEVEKKLAKNQKLHGILGSGIQYAPRSIGGGAREMMMTIPFDLHKLELLSEYIAKGLAHYHWGLDIGANAYVRASFFSKEDAAAVNSIFIENASKRVVGDLGNGVFRYEGIQSAEDINLTLWKMSIFGAEVIDDSRIPEERAQIIFCFTARKDSRTADHLASLFGESVDKLE